MATPTLIAVSGTIESSPGVPDPLARLSFDRKTVLTHADGTLVEPENRVADIQPDGTFSVDLPATVGDPAWNPTGWEYAVTLRYSDDRPPVRWGLTVPADASGGTWTIGEDPPTVPVLPGWSFALVNHTHTPDQVGFLVLPIGDPLPPGTPDGKIVIRY